MIHNTRERRRKQNLGRILAAARGIVLTHGLDGLTVSRLAREVGYTPGALYRYFPSKGALIAALDREILEGWADLLERIASPEPLASILGCAQAMARLAVVRREDFALIAATLADPRQLVEDPADAVHLPALRHLLTTLSAEIARGTELGRLHPGHADQRAVVFIFSLMGVLQLQKLARFDPHALDPAVLARTAALDLLVGWGAEPQTLSTLLPTVDQRVEAAIDLLLAEGS